MGVVEDSRAGLRGVAGEPDRVLGDAEAMTLRAVKLTKRYSGVTVLKNVDFGLGKASIHGIAGENGAGKSTFLSILSGKTMPDAGSVFVEGREISLGSPKASLSAGISIVHQELMVVQQGNALDNVFLGFASRRMGLFKDTREMRERFEEIVRGRLRSSIRADSKMSELSTGSQQLIEIARAVARGAKILLLDEPTAALSIAEKDALFEVVRDLQSEGVSIVLVTHDLGEMQSVCDVISVFRDGTRVDTRPSEAWSKNDLISAMAGEGLRNDDSIGLGAGSLVNDRSEVVLSLRNVSVQKKDFVLNVDLHANRIVGLAGLMGSGRSSLLRALAGDGVEVNGSLLMNGNSIGWPGSPKSARKAGFYYIPEDRKLRGLVMGRSAAENIMLGSLWDASRGIFVGQQRLMKKAETVAGQVRLPSQFMTTAVERLSGGTQQKVLFGRAFTCSFKVLLADEPTRGVDVNARAEIWAMIRILLKGGRCALVALSDIDEMLEVVDEVLVIPRHGSALLIPGLSNGGNRAEVVEAMFK